MKIPSIKNNFSEAVIERGHDYYKEGRIRSLVLDNNKARAVVVGNRNYKVTLDLKKKDFRCTCPCDFNCKHAVAVLYELRNNKNIETVEDIQNQLNKRSKDELIKIIQKMLSSEPRFKKLISNNKKDIEKAIKALDLGYGEDIDKFTEDVDELYELINEKKDKLDNLILLFKKCFDQWNDYGGIESLEDSMFDMLESISKEAKKLPKKKHKTIIQDLIELVGEYDFFLDSIDDEGI